MGVLPEEPDGAVTPDRVERRDRAYGTATARPPKPPEPDTEETPG